MDVNLTYLASPYNDLSLIVRHERYIAARTAMAWLLRKGICVYSPIVMCHEMAVHHNMSKDVSFWWALNVAFINRCNSLLVYKLAGWDQSIGVRQETLYALELGMPVRYLNPDFSANADCINSLVADQSR